ncbi:MAG: long-chain-fatty-acid--CoA ligase [Thermodesulfobacteriota bacterium]
MLFRDFLRRNKKIYADEEAVVFEDKRFTFREFGERVDRCSNALIKLGMEKGERIAVLSENCSQYLELYFGITAAGGVIVPLNYRLNPKELISLLEDAGAKMLIFSEDFEDSVEKIKDSLSMVSHYILLDGEKDGTLGYESLLGKAKAEEPDIPLKEEDDFAILYTSGTTSLAKGVVLSHKNLVANTFNQCLELNIQPGSVNLQISPFYHAANAHAFCHVCLHSKNIIIKHVDPEKIARLIQEEKVSYSFIVPTILYRILDMPHLDKFDLSSLKTIVYGGAAITDQRLEESLAKFGYILVQAYGLTETTSFASVLNKEEHSRGGNSIGRGMCGVEVKVVEEGGEKAKDGVVGEILVRGDNVMKGYWKRPELTAESIEKGWLRTGDLASVDDKGYIYVVDRKKDLIISGGVNIYPRDIEETMARHPAVSEVAVFGIPDPQWGESIKAAVVLKPGKEATEQEILDFTRERIAKYKTPRTINFMDTLPKTPSGKILKRTLKETYK